MSDNIDEILEMKEKSGTEQRPDETNEYKFNTLRGLAKFISGFGWVLVVVGGIGFLIGLGVVADDESIGLSVIGGSSIAILNGLILVVFGQLVSCFVEIEKNTRMTYQALNK